MLHETINYTEDGRVHLTTYVLDVYRRTQGMTRPAMIVLPGGGYEHISTSEGEPVALTFNQLGYNAFVLTYSVGDESRWPNPLVEVAWAVKTIREHAEEWQIDPNKIATVGFSAGGSLSGIFATHWNNPVVAETLGCAPEDIMPNACCVGYGPSDLSLILDMDEAVKAQFVAGGEGAMIADGTPEASFVNYINETTRPMFVWHSRTDEVVSAQNAMAVGSKMYELGLPFELHVFDDGHHGQSSNNRISHPDDADRGKSIGMWVPLADMWLRRLWGMNE